MKRVVCGLAAVAVLVAGCSKKNGEDDKKLSVDVTSITLNSAKTQQLTASENNVTWETANAFVAEVNVSGVVTGKHLGRTNIRVSNGTNSAECAVEVIPVYSTYKEPVLEFGATMAAIKSKETRTLSQSTATSLVYNGEKNSIMGVAYLFEGGKLASAGVAVASAYAEELTDFLLERYMPIGQKDDTFYFLNDEESKATVGIGLLVQNGYLMVMYVPVDDNKVKSVLPDRSYEATFQAIFEGK